MRQVGSWQLFKICRVEDLANALFGANLEAVQLRGPRLRGSVAFAAPGKVIFSSGRILSNVAITGTLGFDAITFVVGLQLAPGSRYWLNTVHDGDVCVFMPGARHDAIYAADTLYMAASLPVAQLATIAARRGVGVDAIQASGTRLLSRPLPPHQCAVLRQKALQLHAGDTTGGLVDCGFAMLDTLIAHYASHPPEDDRQVTPRNRAMLVQRARDHICANLDGPITLAALAAAVGTSQRSLARAFYEVLREGPASYIRRMRLHGIRRELVGTRDASRTVSEIAAHWGMGEPGRMAGRYRALFGERPTETLASSMAVDPSTRRL